MTTKFAPATVKGIKNARIISKYWYVLSKSKLPIIKIL
jgi:hypothetical protein